jgi:hypothetical protein
MSDKNVVSLDQKILVSLRKWWIYEGNKHLRKRLQFLLAPSFKRGYSKDKQYV